MDGVGLFSMAEGETDERQSVMLVDFNEVFWGRYFAVATRLNDHGLDFDLAI
jgi:hypothetical protein